MNVHIALTPEGYFDFLCNWKSPIPSPMQDNFKGKPAPFMKKALYENALECDLAQDLMEINDELFGLLKRQDALVCRILDATERT